MTLRPAVANLVRALARDAVKRAMSSKRQTKDPKTYTVYGLLAAGSRFTDDYDEDDAVEEFLRLHPEATESEVRAELHAEIKRRDAR